MSGKRKNARWNNEKMQWKLVDVDRISANLVQFYTLIKKACSGVHTLAKLFYLDFATIYTYPW